MEQENERQRNGQVEQRDTGHSIQPGTTMPPTMLVTELDNGTLILQGRPDGPRAYLSPAMAMPLKRELTAAFGHIELAAVGDDQDENR